MKFKIAKTVPANVAGNRTVEMGGFHCEIPGACIVSHATTLAQHFHAALHFVAGLFG